jgi:hypothetical protein
MELTGIPFGITDWSDVAPTEHSGEMRDSIVAVLRRAGVPDHVVTYFHITEVPRDDIDQRADSPPNKTP